jgi:predicted ATP-grasp superfamily ATP-dependent carboligase
MLNAIVADFQQLSGVEVVTLLDESPLPDIGHLCIRVCGLDEERHFREMATGCDSTLVIAPEFGHLLEKRSEAVRNAGGSLLGSLPEAIRLTADKLACAHFWKGRGVCHPRTEEARKGEREKGRKGQSQSRPPRSLSPPVPLSPPPPSFILHPSSFSGPWVMKPRFGAGSQATFLIHDRDNEQRAWSAAFEECPEAEFIVQTYVCGQAVSVALLIGPGQTIPLLPARQHLSRDGRFRYEGGSLPLPPTLAERAIALALQALAGIEGLRGYVGVDLVLGDTGDDYVIEINPRLTTSYLGLRRMCQKNIAELILRMAYGETVAMPTWQGGSAEWVVAGGEWLVTSG